ncbi:cystatin-like [Lampris incognitus]|uniref:cystatin-like n=1 Tax=Lampris incognitus TaxID=2546036 RepID=UPI0024B5868F|nr:cystatin-like [Lampris incognitus]
MNPKLVFPVLAAFLAVGAANLVEASIHADINDPRVQEALQFAVVEHNKGTKSLFLSQVAKVIKAQRQVIAGIFYLFTVQMAMTSCRKDGTDQLCTVYQDPEKAQPYQCTFEVLTRPWLIHEILIGDICS